MQEFWKIAVPLCGMGAIASLVLLSLYKRWVKLDIFARLTRKQTFWLMLTFLVLTFVFGLAGLVTHALTNTQDPQVGRAVPEDATASNEEEPDARIDRQLAEIDARREVLERKLSEVELELSEEIEHRSELEGGIQVAADWADSIRATELSESLRQLLEAADSLKQVLQPFEEKHDVEALPETDRIRLRDAKDTISDFEFVRDMECPGGACSITYASGECCGVCCPADRIAICLRDSEHSVMCICRQRN